MKTLLKKIGLLLCALLFSLLGVEMVLRLAPPRAPTPDADRSVLFYEQAVDRDHPWTRGASNPLRIAVIGDSFTEGAGVQVDDRYGARLERMLNLNPGTPPAEVRVYAVGGLSTFQQLPLLRMALEQKPAIVILGICLNDMEDWRKPKPIQRWRDEWMPPPSPFQAWGSRHSRIAAAIYARIWAAGSAQRCVAYYRHLYEPDYSGGARFQNAIAAFRDECTANNAVLVPVIFPLFSFDFSPGRYPLQFAHDRIQQIFRDGGVASLDLLPAYQGASPERMQAIPGVDPHPSEIAHRIAAEAIADYLLEEKIISEGYRPVARASNQQTHDLWQSTLRRMRFQPEPDPTE